MPNSADVCTDRKTFGHLAFTPNQKRFPHELLFQSTFTLFHFYFPTIYLLFSIWCKFTVLLVFTRPKWYGIYRGLYSITPWHLITCTSQELDLFASVWLFKAPLTQLSYFLYLFLLMWDGTAQNYSHAMSSVLCQVLKGSWNSSKKYLLHEDSKGSVIPLSLCACACVFRLQCYNPSASFFRSSLDIIFYSLFL